MAITKYTIISEESIAILEASVEAFLVANPTFQATGQSFFISPTVGYSQVVTVGNNGGGGGGSATAANQVLEIAQLVLLNAKDFSTNTSLVAGFTALLNNLNLEATQLLVKAKTDNLDVALSTINKEATQLLVKAKTDNLDVALSTINKEATQLLVKADLDNILIKLTAVAVVPSLLRVSVVGAVAAGAKSVSVYNAGSADGVWLGVAIKQGEQFSYSANGINNTLGAFAYDGTGTELVITTTV